MVRPDRSIEQCAANIASVCTELVVAADCLLSVDELSKATRDLTPTQVAIPSQASDRASDSDDEPRSPTSIAPTVVTDLIEVKVITQCNEPPVVVQVPHQTMAKEIHSAEERMNPEICSGRFVVFDCAGACVIHDCKISEPITLTIGSIEASVQDDDTPKNLPLGDTDTAELSVAVNCGLQQVSPLTQVKGSAVLALRAQKILASDRKVMLGHQGLIWGDDEIVWHLDRIKQTCSREMQEHDIPDECPVQIDPLAFLGWICLYTDAEILQWYDSHGKPSVMFTVALHQGHWIPIIVRIQDQVLSLSFLQIQPVDRDFVDQVAARLRQAFVCKVQAIHPVQNANIPESCGAAAIMFLAEYLLMEPTPEKPVFSEIHHQFRQQFVERGLSDHLVAHPWMWGAGKEDQVKAQDELAQVLKSHGVPADVVKQRAQQAVAASGASEVIKACQSQAPWRNLKVLGNQVKFQFVLPSELQMQIAERAGKDSLGQPNRKVKGAKQSRSDATLDIDPTKLSLPDGQFSCEGMPVKQIQSHQIGPVAEGIAIVTALEAEPFLRANKVVSNTPLALLVLNAPHNRLGTTLHHMQVTVPARCVLNQEPLLIEASLVQLGSQRIEKTVSKPHADFETVQVATLKLVVYKDEIQVSWETFSQGPVKYILHNMPMLKLCPEKHCQCAAWHNSEEIAVQSAIVDVWRRQFLRKGYKPDSPSTASVFSVCLRVPACLKDRVIEARGTAGVYVEPRSLDSREVDASYEVVWIPKADRKTVTHLKQTNPAATSVVRSDDRWGLRVPVSQAQSLHASVRPDAVYLPQGPRLKFTVAPVPYGTDRKSLSKILKAIGWEAKPVQPTGAIDGGRGNVWSVFATEHPP